MKLNPAELDGGSYRAFVTSIQPPINISEVHSKSLSRQFSFKTESNRRGLDGNVLAPDNSL